MPPLNKEDQQAFWMYDAGTARTSFSTISLDEQQQQQEQQAPRKSLKRRRTQIRFNDEPKVIPVLHRNDFSQEEIANSWFKEPDFARFRLEVANALYVMMHRPNELDDIHYTSRGAESRTTEATKLRRDRRSRSYTAVIAEQEFQKELGGSLDDGRIALRYNEVSKEPAQEAVEIAARDHTDVDSYHQEDVFNDDWITSVSSLDSLPSIGSGADEGLSWDESGFDDDWIKEVSAATSLAASCA